ncbi:glycoside hydrolase family 35 protein [Curtobacterium ammoniigenes]|uniref:glycoside hydrolase family 35 protein n=1 Tax=Curtobacterium ammoniigenes TaxID=395387 RepID=UPI00082D2463|nr:beta-galactosidase family protein [Curtobacterium ammoniigenes]
MRFMIGADHFELDGQPHRILAGALHYFRVHPDQWADRIHKARLMGLNTIETYVAWNAHEAQPGIFDFTAGLDLGRFLDLVHAEGMHAIVRPGPYICAEWWNGGLPPWLFADGTVGIRRNEPQFLEAVRRYLDALAPILVPRQIDAGGPIVLVQIENEYGAYGDDHDYLRALVAMHRDIGLTVPFTTVDQPIDAMLDDGSLPELHKTGSFGSRVEERLARLRQAQPTGPLMCSEFWDGWFDSWGAHHHTTSVAESARELDTLLAAGASVNIYMFHGGTNFGFTNGANDKGVYRPIATSYDYDAPLDEAGNPTPKFDAFREVIARYAPVPSEPLIRTATTAPAALPPICFDRALPLHTLLPHLTTFTAHDRVPTMDDLGAATGFILYRTEVELSAPAVLHIGEVRDRAQLFLDGAAVAILEREHHDHAVTLPAVGRATLELLVEDQGRVNYGPRIGEPKGLIGPITLDGRPLARWSAAPLRLEGAFDAGAPAGELLRSAAADPATTIAGPAVALATVRLQTVPQEVHLALDGFGKGVAWVNGFCLGRYWSRGPQRTLYVPSPLLHSGDNEVIVFEQHASPTRCGAFVAAADLGHLEE